MEPLIQSVEQHVLVSMATFPQARLRVIGHSMGGLIWLELLNRQWSWWSRLDSLVLLASPVGGADLARMADPFRLGLGIARDLGTDRRHLAEAIAQRIPVLTIAGDIDGGSDGTIAVGSTQFQHARSMTLPGLSHTAIRNHPDVVRMIKQFWSGPSSVLDISAALIHQLRKVPGMTDAHPRDFRRARVFASFSDGTTIRTWKNPFQVDHVFVADLNGWCLFSGFVGWVHSRGLSEALEAMKNQEEAL